MSKASFPDPWLQRLARLALERAEQGRSRVIAEPAGVDFCSNDYLGLRGDPRLAEAGARAATQFGSGAGAARLLRGTTPLHDGLERALAQWKSAEACLLLNSGYQCNATLIPALLQPGDAVFSDALNHASIIDGCRMAKACGARLSIYGHLDLGDLEARLQDWSGHREPGSLALVVTDAVFSMEGDAADLPGLLEICRRYQALLMLDEAHATGLLGGNGSGLAELQGVQGQVPLVMGTLGKALGCFGAYVAGDRLLVDHLINACRGFIFSTALPASLAGAALAAVQIAQAEPWRRERALGLASLVRRALALPEHPSAIVPVVLGEERTALAQARRLQEKGFDVRAVRPPTVPVGRALLRITTGAHVRDADVEALIKELVSWK